MFDIEDFDSYLSGKNCAIGDLDGDGEGSIENYHGLAFGIGFLEEGYGMDLTNNHRIFGANGYGTGGRVNGNSIVYVCFGPGENYYVQR